MPEKKLTIERSMADFKKAYRAKRKLIEREMEDHKFALGDQWNKEDMAMLEKAGMKPITDNRIQPNIFLLTGLERQNRTDFKAFPEGEEDGIKAEVASALFKHAIKMSDFSYISSDQFKDGITCGESHLELYLDNTHNLLNAKPCWKKVDGNIVFPESGFRNYDFSDARYVYKLSEDLSLDEMISLFPDKKAALERAEKGKLSLDSLGSDQEEHRQHKDYPKESNDSGSEDEDEGCFDLLERYYKKWVETAFIADKQTGQLQESESAETAEAFVADYQGQIEADQQAYAQAQQQALDAHMAQMMAVDPQAAALPPEQHMAMIQQAGQMPPPPPERDPDRFVVIKRMVPEIWCFAHTPGVNKPLADERAWFYPKWKSYPIIPFFARFSTAPLTGDDRHLLVQGLVHGVKGSQEKHNKAEMLMLRHLNTSANSGWLSEEDAWVNDEDVKNFGSASGINLKYRKGSQKPERIFPSQLSNGHAQISLDSVEAIKGALGINADLLAAQEGGGDSGRAIALRQRQGLLMVQELFDNLTRTRTIAGKFLLSQLGQIFDTETAQKVLGEAFLKKNFPPPMTLVAGPMGEPVPGPDGQPAREPMKDASGKPMTFDAQMAELAIAEVLKGDLGEYDVAVGESAASETMKMANSQEVKDIATAYPGLIPPDIIVEESQLPQSTKNRILSAIQNAQAMAQGTAGKTPPKPPAEADAA